MKTRHLTLDLNGDRSEGRVPIVYLACRLTGLTNEVSGGRTVAIALVDLRSAAADVSSRDRYTTPQ
jgi:hypothetical protein